MNTLRTRELPIGVGYLFLALAAAFLFAQPVSAFSLQCKVGTTRCIKSQDTDIPSKQAIEILDRCGEFILDDIGRIAMRLSYKELDEKSGGKITPLVRAWHAYGDLIESSLKFERKQRAEDARYLEIKRACFTLQRDFNDDAKWSK